jgi:hypothetical protein
MAGPLGLAPVSEVALSLSKEGNADEHFLAPNPENNLLTNSNFGVVVFPFLGVFSDPEVMWLLTAQLRLLFHFSAILPWMRTSVSVAQRPWVRVSHPLGPMCDVFFREDPLL